MWTVAETANYLQWLFPLLAFSDRPHRAYDHPVRDHITPPPLQRGVAIWISFGQDEMHGMEVCKHQRWNNWICLSGHLPLRDTSEYRLVSWTEKKENWGPQDGCFLPWEQGNKGRWLAKNEWSKCKPRGRMGILWGLRGFRAAVPVLALIPHEWSHTTPVLGPF